MLCIAEKCRKCISPGGINNLKYILLLINKIHAFLFRIAKIGFINWVQNITIMITIKELYSIKLNLHGM